MRNVRSLNIGNTFRSANINTFVKPHKIGDYHKLDISKLRKAGRDRYTARDLKIKAKFAHHRRDKRMYRRKYKDTLTQYMTDIKPYHDVTYVGEHGNNENRQMERAAILAGLHFIYYTDSTLPLVIITASQANKHALCIYKFHNKIIPVTHLKSIYRASKLCRTGLRINIYPGRTSINHIIFSLFDARFLLERVELFFPAINNSDYKSFGKTVRSQYMDYKGEYYPTTETRLAYYAKLHEVLARWEMQLWLSCVNRRQAKVLKKEGLSIASQNN